MKHINVFGALAAMTTLAGVVASPAVSGFVPAKAAAIITAVGAVAQAVTKAIHDVQRPPAPPEGI